MKTIFRNFYVSLCRFKLASALNIFGLSVAFAAFMVIMMQVNYEYSFDKSYKNGERIYRVEQSWDKIEYSPILARPYAEMLVAGISQIESYALTQPFSGQVYLTVENEGNRAGFKEVITAVYPSYATLFGLDFISGSGAVFKEPNSVIIPSSIAIKQFGATDCVGKSIKVDYKNSPSTVAGVYKDFPASSSQKNAIYINMGDENKDSWNNSNYYLFIRLAKGAVAADVEKALNANGTRADEGWKGSVRVTAIEDMYFSPNLDFDVLPRGNRATTNILIAIAFLVIVIAFINFVNFSTSLTPLRMKSINIQKVLGSVNSALRWKMILESMLFTIVSLGVAFIWIEILRVSGFSQYLLTQIDLATYPMVVLSTVAVAIAAGLTAGVYPAFYSTSAAPALVLKGSFGLSPKGKILRTTLMGIQFVVSMALIMAAIFMQLQNSYIKNFQSGLHTDQVAIVRLSNGMAKSEKAKLLTSQLKESSQINDVAFSQFEIGTKDNYMTWGRDFKDDNINFTCLPVSWNFAKVMGLEIVGGRNFKESDLLQRGGKAIFNEKARKQFNLTTDDVFQGHTDTTAQIVGFVKDFNFKSLRYGIEPMALYLFDDATAWQDLGVAYVKTSGNPFQAADYIERVMKKIDPLYPVEINFYDAVFNELYHKERNTTMQITAFSLLAVVISLLGVFGIVFFETQFRRKEIGVRKVYGSTVSEILYMFNSRYVAIILICAAIATPLAYLGVNSWLESFEYRIETSWWVFVLSTLIVAVITLLTVTVQSYRAATVDPVKSLITE